MQVILLHDVPRVGKQYQVVNVSDGYANNFLLPRQLAEPATERKVTELEKSRKTKEAEEEAKQAALKEKLETLIEKSVTLTMKADGQGHLYKKIQISDITNALAQEYGINLPDTALLLDSPITEVGEYSVPIQALDVQTACKVNVIRE